MGNKQSSAIVVKSGIWYTFSNFLLKGLDFLTIPIFTRMMTTVEFGDFNNYASWLQLVLIIATLSLYASLYRAQFDYQNSFDDYVFSILAAGTVNAGLLLLPILLFPHVFEDIMEINAGYIIFMLVYTMVRPALDVYQQVKQLRYDYKSSVRVAVITSVSTVLFSLLVMVLSADKYQARIVGAYTPMILISFVLYIRFWRNGHRIQFAYIRYALKICLPYIPHLLAMTVLASTDRIMIRRFCGANDTAMYSLAYTCGLAVAVLWNAMNTTFSPWLAEKLHTGKHQAIRRVSVGYVALFAVPMIFILLLSPELLLLLGGEKYVDAQYAMPPVMLGCFFQFIYSMYVNIEQYEKKTIGMAVATVSAALLNYTLNLIFIPRYGYIAAAYTTLIGYVFLAVVHYFLVRRLHLSNVYRTGPIVLIAFFEVVAATLIVFLYQRFTIRIIIACLLMMAAFLILVLHRKKIAKLLHP